MFGREKPAPNTIPDKQWRSIQDRAAKANPKHASIFSDEAAKARRRGADNYRNRKWC